MTNYEKKFFTLEGLQEQNLMFEGFTDGTVTNCGYTPLFTKDEMLRIVEVNSILENDELRMREEMYYDEETDSIHHVIQQIGCETVTYEYKPIKVEIDRRVSKYYQFAEGWTWYPLNDFDVIEITFNNLVNLVITYLNKTKKEFFFGATETSLLKWSLDTKSPSEFAHRDKHNENLWLYGDNSLPSLLNQLEKEAERFNKYFDGDLREHMNDIYSVSYPFDSSFDELVAELQNLVENHKY